MIILRVAACLLLGLVASTVPAAQPADPCKTQSNTPEINACLKQEFDAADLELNRVYRALLRRIDATRAPDVDHLAVRKLLVEGQRNWVAFRKNDCMALYKLYEGGSIRNAQYLGCMADRTEKRIAELKDWDGP